MIGAVGAWFNQTKQVTAARVGLLACLCSGVAVAAIPLESEASAQNPEWQALGLAPLSAGGDTGLRVDATDAVQPIDVAPQRSQVDLAMILGPGEPVGAMLVRAGVAIADAKAAHAMLGKIRPGTSISLQLGAAGPSGKRDLRKLLVRAGMGSNLEIARDGDGALRLIRHAVQIDTTPLRIRGRAGDGLYWSLRAAGVSPQSAAEYLRALATEIDVGADVAPTDQFDLVVANRRAADGDQQTGPLLYAGLRRTGSGPLQLVRWRANGGDEWIDVANLGRAASHEMAWPTQGRITSGFGYRVHPILRFRRLHRGVDFGASSGTAIVAAADGQVTAAGWSGGYGRQVRLAHAGGLATSYSHMSQIVAEEGTFVRRGELIGYVGSSGLSTGPHLHYEVYRGGVPINPLSVRFASSAMVDAAQAKAVKARLKALLSVGSTRG